MGALAGFGLALVLPCKAHAQEGDMMSLVLARNAQQTWERAALLAPGPMTKKPEPTVLVPIAKTSPAQKIIDESERCTVEWHSQRRKKPSRIICYTKG